MAGPWYVDPESGLTTNDGLSTSTPWQLIPGQTGASAQTGYGVSSGDVVNVKNGTTTALRILPPATNMTFRGYGVAGNVLVLTLPNPYNPSKTINKRVMREAGAHEGMWTIDMANINGSAIGATGTAIGCTFEDVQILGPSLLGTHSGIQMGTSGSTGALTGFTLRRFRIANQNNRGLSSYMLNMLVEYGQIEYTADDNITLWATTGSTARTGSIDTFRHLDLREPNLESALAVAGVDGDILQVVPIGGAYNATTVMENIRVYKTTSAKQATVIHCTSAAANITLRNWHTSGGGALGHLVGHLAGTALYENLYIENGGPTSLALFRFDPADSSPPAYAMATGSTLTIRKIFAAGDAPGMWDSVRTLSGSYSMDGTIAIEGCTVVGNNANANTWSSQFAFWASGNNITYGTSYQFTASNNCIRVSGAKPQVIVQTGAAGNSKWAFRNNNFNEGEFRIGATSYASLAAFQAAHAPAANNTTSDPLLTASYRPKSTSPLLGAGTHLGYRRDIEGKQRPNPPSIGAYDVATLKDIS
jgi:hypothetical protein